MFRVKAHGESSAGESALSQQQGPPRTFSNQSSIFRILLGSIFLKISSRGLTFLLLWFSQETGAGRAHRGEITGAQRRGPTWLRQVPSVRPRGTPEPARLSPLLAPERPSTGCIFLFLCPWLCCVMSDVGIHSNRLALKKYIYIYIIEAQKRLGLISLFSLTKA